MLDLDGPLELALELADVADQLTLPDFERGPTARAKTDGSPVTATDRLVEERLRAGIRARFPDHAILGEEGGLEGSSDAPRWVVDPIDATKNFVRGNPAFATLIALELEQRPVVAVVSAPALGARWDACAGGGARRDGLTIHVSTVTDLREATVSLGGLGYFLERGDGGAVERIARATQRQRGFGDFWQHCLVAEGVIDAAAEAEVSRWDLSAIQCLVEEAGGRFTDFDAIAHPGGGTAVSSNGLIHDQLLAVIAGVDPKGR